MRKVIKRVSQRQTEYQKTIMVGIIIYVNESENWCNVELMNGSVVYRIPFYASNLRLRRIKSNPSTITENFPNFLIISSKSLMNLFATEGGKVPSILI